ncbi:penicillin-binding transpeptidase domain-containing protein [Jatrophihabitans endophyticus]|uniref:penicillin-binding transpeptidase domain-containing protein n=1 Tax=Jatrophihabitans endophyticus TaxID=1206085 RepID=UPI0019DE4A14|nr:penicillin-binding transpeptidase domain-containing protein [Jatrophihabitans endophyticus]MBE7187304.1 penicillin-binding protein 2 [Jatrophihabitans endophyticus]
MSDLRDDRRRRASRPPTPRRLVIVVALVVSLMGTLLVRLYYVQLLDPHKPVQTAQSTHEGVVSIPAPRGLIVDDEGRTLVANTSKQVVTVDRDVLQRRNDKGRAVLRRLGTLLRISPVKLAAEITPCSTSVPAPCSTGEPYAPVTVDDDATTGVVLAVKEHAELFPGVAIDTVTEPSYPGGSLAAQVLGYTSQVTAADTKADPKLVDSDTIGASGLEDYYDSVLRGVDGKQYVELNPQGITVGQGRTVPAQQGDTLVTSINSKVQALAEKSLAEQITASRKAGYKAPSGSVVIMDPDTGRIVASASYPTYDPSQFIGGISEADYAKLTAASAGTPLLDRTTAGEYAPGSTFKLITSSSLITHHEITEKGIYPCPGSLDVDGQVKTNYDSEDLGPINLENALGYSCDTFFYRPEANEFFADQKRIEHHKKPHEWLQRMAADYGVGRTPDVDLPAGEQAAGSYADREILLARWKKYRSDYCATWRKGYPDITNAKRRAYLTELAMDNCKYGYVYRAGDNADMAIGQGETTMSPLQLAVAYSAMLNGGKIYEPTFGWGVVNAQGKLVHTIEPRVRSHLPVSQQFFNFYAKALSFRRGWAVSGAYAYIGSSIQNELGGKTGTAQVYGKQDTSWLASWGPTYKTHGKVSAHLVMVGMIEQAGTGAMAAGPMEKRIWDGLLGAHGKTPLLRGSHAPTTLPKIGAQVQVRK